jgi:hypothetical protein
MLERGLCVPISPFEASRTGVSIDDAGAPEVYGPGQIGGGAPETSRRRRRAEIIKVPERTLEDCAQIISARRT